MNNKGSILSVAFVVMAILTFSLTSLSVYTLRTIENTERTSNTALSRNEAQSIISQAMNDFRKGTDDFDGLEDLLEDEEYDDEEILNYDQYPELLDNLIKDVEALYEDDEAVKKLGIKEVPDMLGDFDDEHNENIHATSFRFSYTFSEDRDVVQYLHVTNHGIEYQEYTAFKFSMGTNADMVFSGGNLDGSDAEEPYIYAGTLYDSYLEYGLEENNFYQLDNDGPTNYLKSHEGALVTTNYQRCIYDREDKNDDCLETTTNSALEQGNSLVLNKHEYKRIGETEDSFLDDLFSGFDMERHYYRRFTAHFEDHIDDVDETNYLDYIGDYFEDYTIIENATEDDLDDINEHTLLRFDGEMEINKNALDIGDNVVFFDGDVRINNLEEIDDRGNLFINGDLMFEGNEKLLSTASFFVYGDMIADFEPNGGLSIKKFSEGKGITLFTLGNIEILSGDFLYEESGNVETNAFFFFANGSIFINSDQGFNMAGVLYASANGDGLQRIQTRNAPDDELENFHGIFINSQSSGTATPDEDEYEDAGETTTGLEFDNVIHPDGVEITGFSGIGKDNEHRFILRPMSEVHPGGGNNNKEQELKDSFNNVPSTFETLVLYPGEYTFQTSTFSYRITD